MTELAVVWVNLERKDIKKTKRKGKAKERDIFFKSKRYVISDGIVPLKWLCSNHLKKQTNNNGK